MIDVDDVHPVFAQKSCHAPHRLEIGERIAGLGERTPDRVVDLPFLQFGNDRAIAGQKQHGMKAAAVEQTQVGVQDTASTPPVAGAAGDVTHDAFVILHGDQPVSGLAQQQPGQKFGVPQAGMKPGTADQRAPGQV